MSSNTNIKLDQVDSNIVHREANGFLVVSSNDEKVVSHWKALKYSAYRRLGESEEVFEKIGEISFQKGHPDSCGVNGFTNEAVIAILIDRLLHLNENIPCEENVKALARLQEAKELLEKRQQRILAEAQN